jgi:hypothetical protein
MCYSGMKKLEFKHSVDESIKWPNMGKLKVSIPVN